MYAYCDVSSLVNNLAVLADYNRPEQYIVVASRLGGFLINEWWELSDCISQGRERGNGYDVGICSTKALSAALDTAL